MTPVDPTLGVAVVQTGLLVGIFYRLGGQEQRISANRERISTNRTDIEALRTDGGEDV